MMFTKFFIRVFEDPSGDPPANDPPAPSGATFTQDDVNKIVQTRLAKAKQGHEKEMAALKGRVETLNLSSKQKEALEEQMEQLRLESASDLEKATANFKKAEKSWTKERESLLGERDGILKLYTSERIQRDILGAASAGENHAYNGVQIVDILAPRTRVVQVIGEDNKPTGKMKTVVTMQDQKEDGTVVDLQLSPAEAVAKMKELPDMYGNLFVSGAKSGLGGSGNQSGGKSSNPMDGGMEGIKKMYREMNLS